MYIWSTDPSNKITGLCLYSECQGAAFKPSCFSTTVPFSTSVTVIGFVLGRKCSEAGLHVAVTSRLFSTGRCIIQPQSTNINEGFSQPSAVLAAVEIGTQLCCFSSAPRACSLLWWYTPHMHRFILRFPGSRYKKPGDWLEIFHRLQLILAWSGMHKVHFYSLQAV